MTHMDKKKKQRQELLKRTAVLRELLSLFYFQNLSSENLESTYISINQVMDK